MNNPKFGFVSIWTFEGDFPDIVGLDGEKYRPDLNLESGESFYFYYADDETGRIGGEIIKLEPDINGVVPRRAFSLIANDWRFKERIEDVRSIS